MFGLYAGAPRACRLIRSAPSFELLSKNLFVLHQNPTPALLRFQLVPSQATHCFLQQTDTHPAESRSLAFRCGSPSRFLPASHSLPVAFASLHRVTKEPQPFADSPEKSQTPNHHFGQSPVYPPPTIATSTVTSLSSIPMGCGFAILCSAEHSSHTFAVFALSIASLAVFLFAICLLLILLSWAAERFAIN